MLWSTNHECRLTERDKGADEIVSETQIQGAFKSLWFETNVPETFEPLWNEPANDFPS